MLRLAVNTSTGQQCKYRGPSVRRFTQTRLPWDVTSRCDDGGLVAVPCFERLFDPGLRRSAVFRAYKLLGQRDVRGRVVWRAESLSFVWLTQVAETS